jgi:hypothetical protein
MTLLAPSSLGFSLQPARAQRFGVFQLQLAPFFDATTDANAGNNGGGGTGGGSNTPPARTFTQAELDEIIEERLGRERTKISTKYKGVDPDDYERLKREDAERRRKEAEEEKNYQAALKSQEESYAQKEKTWKEERESLLGEVKTERIHNRLLNAASKSNAYDPNQVAKLLSDRVKLGDDRQPITLSDGGEPAYKDGKPLTVDQLVSDYLDRNPHLVKASGTTGAGANGGSSTSGEGQRTKGEKPELTKARDTFAQMEQKLAGKRPTAAELAELQKAKRIVDQLEREAKSK